MRPMSLPLTSIPRTTVSTSHSSEIAQFQRPLQRKHNSKCQAMRLVLLLVVFLLGVCEAGADDGIILTVNYAATPGGTALTWTGGSPVFEVYRSTNPALVVAAANKLGETNDSSWTDVPPPGGVHFYKVVLRTNHPPV